MKKIFEDYGRVITVAVAIIAIIGIVLSAMPLMQENYGTFTTAFMDQVNDKANNGSGNEGSGGSSTPTPAEYGINIMQWDVSESQDNSVVANYYVKEENQTPSQTASINLLNVFKPMTAYAADEKTVVIDGVTYYLSDDDTLVITGTGNMIENLTSKMYGYQDIINNVQSQFGIKCVSGSVDELFNILKNNETCYRFDNSSIYPIELCTKNGGIICCNPVPDEVINYIDSIKNNYIIPSPKNVIIKNGVTNISKNAFLGCSNLTSIIIENSVKNIEQYAFKNCNNLTSITIPDSVTNIGNYAFAGCSSLTSITIPDSVTNIGNYAFADCSNLIRATIGNKVTKIADEMFKNCNNLTSITIPDSVTSIGPEAFRNCSSLTSITIPDSLTDIYSGAFYNCSSLTNITIPKNVKNIVYDTFGGCSNLISIQVDPNNNFYSSVDGVLFDKNKTKLIKYPANNPRVKYEIPNSVTTINGSSFLYCLNLTSIIIPNSVTTIGDNAFSGCTALKSVTIPNSIKTIGRSSFTGMASGSVIYCETQDVARLVTKKYTAFNTTVVVDASKF